jgi:hypothetical protein
VIDTVQVSGTSLVFRNSFGQYGSVVFSKALVLTGRMTSYLVGMAAGPGGGSIVFTGHDGSSATMVFQGLTVPPPRPTNLVATAGNGQVSLTWTASSGATTYNVSRGTRRGDVIHLTTIATGLTSLAYTNTGLTNGTTYLFSVSAVNAAGESPDSLLAQATPQGPLELTDRSGKSFRWKAKTDQDTKISWNPPTEDKGELVAKMTFNPGKREIIIEFEQVNVAPIELQKPTIFVRLRADVTNNTGRDWCTDDKRFFTLELEDLAQAPQLEQPGHPAFPHFHSTLYGPPRPYDLPCVQIIK